MTKRLTLEIEGRSMAFDGEQLGSKWSDGHGAEFARILREVADAVEADGAYPDEHSLRDRNGAVCGRISIEVL